MNTAGTSLPPPPPPPIPTVLPSSRLPTEIPARAPPVMNPPAALAGAMMKDKKPFTYTPGGIDLSEIKSPRMQKRLLRNAQLEGVRPSPLAQQTPQVPGSSSGAAPAASHGIAVQVLPVPGMGMGPQPPPQPKEPPKSKRNVCGPPPPPPPFVVGSERRVTLPAPAPPQTTITSPPTIASPPTSPPTQAHQPVSDLGASIPAAPPPPSSGSAAWRSIHPSATPSAPPPAKAEQHEPCPPPPPPPQAVRVPTSPLFTQEPPLSPPAVRSPVVQSPAVPSSPHAQQELSSQPWSDWSPALPASDSQTVADDAPQLYHPPTTDHLLKERVLSPDEREEQPDFSVAPLPSWQAAGGDQYYPASETPTEEPAVSVQLTPKDSEYKDPSPVQQASPVDIDDVGEPSPIREPSPVQESLPVRKPSPVQEFSPVREPSPDQEPSPVREPSPIEIPLPVKEPSPVEMTLPIRESSPVKEPSPFKDSSPVTSPSPIEKPSPAREPFPAEPSPSQLASSSPIRDSSPSDQESSRDSSPASQASFKEPSPVTQDSSPASQFSPRQESPVVMPGYSTLGQVPSQESLPVDETLTKDNSPIQTLPAKDPSPVSKASAESLNSEQSNVSETSIRHMEPPQISSPPSLKEPSMTESAPWRRATAEDTPAAPIEQTPWQTIQSPQTVASPSPAPEREAEEQITSPVIQTLAQEPCPRNLPASSVPGKEAPSKQTSQPCPPHVTQIPIQQTAAMSQPSVKQQQHAAPSWQSPTLTEPEPAQPVTRHIPVRMASPPPRSSVTSPPVNTKGTKLIRQASLPTKPSSPQVSPPNAQLGSISISSTSDGESPLSPFSDKSSQGSSSSGLDRAPLPWMCPPKQGPSPPPFIVSPPPNAQQRHLNQLNRIVRQKSSGPELAPSQSLSQATVIPQPEVYQHPGVQRQWSFPTAQHQQQPQPPRVQQSQPPQQRTRTIPIHIQTPNQSQSIPVHVQRQQQQQQPQARERIIPIMIEQDTPSNDSAQNSSHSFPSQQGTFIPINIMRQQSEPNYQQTMQQQPAYQSQQSFQPQPTFQPQPVLQPQSTYQSQPAFQQSQKWQHPQQPQQQQQQQQQQQPWSNAPRTAFSPPQFPSSSLIGGANGAFLPYNSPAGLYSNNSALDALHQMQQSLEQLNSGIQNAFPRFIQKKMSDSITPRTAQSSSPNQNGSDQGESMAPVQSRSFRVLQNVLSNQDVAEPQGPVHIPNLRQQQKPSPLQQPVQYQPPTHYQPTSLYQQPGGVTSSAPTEDAPPEPKKYMGGSIPSRSFKMLQALTSTDDVAGPGQSDL